MTLRVLPPVVPSSSVLAVAADKLPFFCVDPVSEEGLRAAIVCCRGFLIGICFFL